MNVSQFIDDVISGNASTAKDNLNNLLSAKAFEAIDGQKKELAHTLFGGNFTETNADNDVQETQD